MSAVGHGRAADGTLATTALVLLAAGASTRLGRCKALAALGPDPDDTPLARLAEAAAVLHDPRPLVVGGRDADALRAALPPGFELLVHSRWAEGRTGGVAAAARARPGRDLCVAPVDVPRVPAAVFAALEAAWSAAGRPPRGWLAPRHAGRHGHPLWLGRALAAELAALSETAPDATGTADRTWRGRPLRAWRARAEPVWGIPVDAPEVLEDLDTPDDLRRLRGERPGSGAP